MPLMILTLVGVQRTFPDDVIPGLRLARRVAGRHLPASDLPFPRCPA